MSESSVLNCVEQQERTRPISLNDVTNEDFTKSGMSIDGMAHHTSLVEKESILMTEKIVNGLKPSSSLHNGFEESCEAVKPDSVEFTETKSKENSAKGMENSYVEESHSDLEDHHHNGRGDSCDHSSSDVIYTKETSVDSWSGCDTDKKVDFDELDNSTHSNSNTPAQTKNEKELTSINNDISKECHSDTDSLGGTNEVIKNLPEPTSSSSSSCTTVDADCGTCISSKVDHLSHGTPSEVDVDQEIMRDSDMIDSPKTVDSCSNFHDESNASSSDLVGQIGNETSNEDSTVTVVGKSDDPSSTMEDEVETAEKSESEIKSTIEMVSTSSKLDTNDVAEEYAKEVSSEARSPQGKDDTTIISVEPSRVTKTLSEAEPVSIEATDKQGNLNSCQDSFPQKNEADKKIVSEASPSSDIQGDIDEVKMDIHKTSDESDKIQEMPDESCKTQETPDEFDKKEAMSPLYINLDNEMEPLNEEEDKKGIDLLRISKVESYTDVDEGMKKIKDDETKTACEVKPPAKEGNAEDIIEKKDVKEEGTALKEQEKMVDDSLPPADVPEVVKEPTLKDEAIVIEPDSAMKVSFKDILKTKDDLESPKDTKQCKTVDGDPVETIIIDEVEMTPSVSKNLRGDDMMTEESLRSEKGPIEITDAKQADIPSREGESSKKRTCDSSVEVSGTISPKRQRLDNAVNKLGDHVGVCPSEATTVIMDSDDDMAASPQTSGTTAKDGKMESNGQTVNLSSEMLRNLIKASLKSFMSNQILEKEQIINERMKKMEAAIDLWRETAKHLEKSMNELTSYTKEFRKCKSQSVKLKNLASRTVAVQVSLQQNQPKTTNSSNQNRSTSLSLPPSVLRHPISMQPGPSTNRPMAQSNGNMRPNHPPTNPRQVRPGGSRGGPAIPPGSQQPNRQKAPNMNQNSFMTQSQPLSSQQSHGMRPMANSHMVQQSGRAAISRLPNSPIQSHSIPGSSSNMIDLTAEDDASKQTKATPQASPRAMRASFPPSMQSNARGNPDSKAVSPSTNQIGRSGGPGLNTSSKSLPGGSVQHLTNMRNVNGMCVVSGTSKSEVPVNSAGLTNGQATRAPSAESSSKTLNTSGFGPPASSRSLPPSVYVPQPTKHPAPLPVEKIITSTQTTKLPPPKPSLKISRVAQGIVLSWNMPIVPVNVATIASYQLFAYQETNSAPSSSLWKKVGDVKALPLPMACTLVQFQEGNKYYFAVRAIDQFGRWGEYSDPSSIYLFPK